MIKRTISWRPAVAALALLSLWSCDSADLTGLAGTGDPIQLSKELSLGELEQALQADVARLEIELFPQEAVARRVEVRSPEARSEDETVAGRVGAVSATETGGALTLLLGGLELTFDGETALFGPGGDDISAGSFIEQVQAALADGLEPAVIAKRPPPDAPQDAGVAFFLATEIRRLAEPEGWSIAINADGDNVEVNTAPQDGEPDGWIHVLGLTIELRISDGITEIVAEETEVDDVVEFEGHVSSVDVQAGTFTFSDGTLVRITDLTQILEADVEHPLTSLEQVQAALAEELDVVAWGGGILESEEPRVIAALELRFAVAGGEEEEDNTVEFEGHVSHVDIGASTFTLKNGTVLEITDATAVVTTGEGELLGSLEEVAGALEAGKQIVAFGAAEVSGHEPLTLVALEMRFRVVVHKEEFEGMVASVQLGEGTATLANGTTIQIAPEVTEFKQAEQGESLLSLEAVYDAIEAGGSVVAWGHGEVESEEPLRITALEVYFVLSE